MTKTIYDVDEIANVGIEQADLETTGKVLSRMRDNLRAALANR